MPVIDSVYDISDRAKVELKAWLEPWFRFDGGDIEWEDVGTGGGGTGGTSGHIIEDEGVPLTQRKYLDFVGAGVTATDDGANNKTIVTIPSAGFFGIPDQNVGYWYTCPFAKPGPQTARNNGALDAIPFIVTRTTTYDRIGVICSSTATGSAYRFGIYTESNGYPATLVLDAGTVATTGATGEKSIVISQQLTAGLYWLVGVSQTSGSSAIVSGGVIPYLLRTSTNLADADASANGGGGSTWTLAGISGSLPSPFTAGGSVAGAGTITPFLRVASVP